MKLLYIGCHETLEYDEVKLFTELGIDVFSYQGSYMNPSGHESLKRPAISGGIYHEEFAQEAIKYAKTKIPKEFFDKFDAVMIMHDPNVIVENWDRMKHKSVIWRSIGQSTSHVENMIRRTRYDGMKIARMSPIEERISGYIGSDTMIRFYKDPDDWKDWNGNEKRVINFTQSLLGRRVFCHYDLIHQLMQGFPSLVYGSGNTDLGGLDGGELSYELMCGTLRDNRVFVYGGTWPSPYTLSFIEAMMTGIPMVCIGKQLAEEVVPQPDQIDYYEIPDIIRDGYNGFISNNINELRDNIHQLLENQDLAKSIGENGRKTAIELFGKEKIRSEWEEFFKTL